MPKFYGDTIWYKEWQDPTTRDLIRMEIFASDDVALSASPTYYELPDGFISKLEMDYEYDKYKLGFSSDVELKAQFNLDTFRSNVATEAIITALFYPLTNVSKTFTPVNTSSANYQSSDSTDHKVTMSVYAGNIIKITRKFISSDDPTTWHTVYIGMQKKGAEEGFDSSTKQLTVNFSGLGKILAESVLTTYLSKIVYSGTGRMDRAAYDYLYEATVNGHLQHQATLQIPAGNEHDWKKNYYYLHTFTEIKNFIEQCMENIYTLVMRTTDSITLETPLPTRYVQTYDMSGDKGSATINEYIITFISDTIDWFDVDKQIYGGWLYEDLKEDYGTIWDFLQDAYKTNLQCGYFNYETLTFESETLLSTTYHTLDINGEAIETIVYKYNVKPMLDILQRSSGAYVDKLDDDLAENEVINTSSRTEQSLSIPITLNNTPVAIAEDGWVRTDDNAIHRVVYDMSKIIGTEVPLIRYSLQNRFYKLYYISIPTDSNGDDFVSGYVPIRVHDWMRIDLGAGKTTDDIVTFVPFDFSVMDNKDRPPSTTEANYVQSQSGLGYINANVCLELYGNREQAGLEIKCFANAGADFSKAGSPFLNPHKCHLYIDLSGIEVGASTPFTNYSKYWDIVKCTIDLLTSETKCELLARTYNV